MSIRLDLEPDEAKILMLMLGDPGGPWIDQFREEDRRSVAAKLAAMWMQATQVQVPTIH